MVDQSSLQPGSVFAGDFRIVRAMSAGGMGAVYVAEQLSTGKPRALKVMLPALVADPSLRRRFEQEARIASLIESEHVVEVVGAGVDAASNLPYLAMELLNGEDLSQLVTRGGPLASADVARIFEQLCHAVGAAHRVGVVHRDLKPENIFLAQARRAGAVYMVKVLDFGIAKIVAEATTRQTAAMGSPIWMAPEQADQSPVTPATDVWALGLIAFYLLAGRSFWKTGNDDYATVPQVLKEVLFEPIVPASLRATELGRRLPPAFDGWFARCVARDPAARFADATEAAAALMSVLHGDIALDATYLPAGLPSAPPASAYPSTATTGPVGMSGTAPPAYVTGNVLPVQTVAPTGRSGKVPIGVAIAILVGVTLFGTVAAGALWWMTKRPSATPVTAFGSPQDASGPSLDAATANDAQSPSETGSSDAAPPVDAGPAKVSVNVHGPSTPTHSPPTPAFPSPPTPAPPAVSPPIAPPAPPPPPQRSLTDLANSAVSADWWTARRALEPKLYAGTATVDDVRLLLKVCKNQRDGACQKACKRVLAGRKP